MAKPPHMSAPSPSDDESTSHEDKTSDSSLEGSDYEVGYCRPPKHTQFQPGQSGNRKGRPKRVPTILEDIYKVLRQRISIREGDRTTTVSKQRALALHAVNSCLKEDKKGPTSLIALVRALGLMQERPKSEEPDTFTLNDQALLDDYIRRRYGVGTNNTKNDSLGNGSVKGRRRNGEA